MHPLFYAALVLAGLTALFLPYYCKIAYSEKNKTTLQVKMFLSSLFLLGAILSLPTAEHTRHGFIYLMLCAFILCFVGDFLLGLSDRMAIFTAGSLCFAAGHTLNLIAFSLASHHFFPDVKWWNGAEIGTFIVLVCVMLLIWVLRKPPFQTLFIPLFAYYFLVALAATKAVWFGLRMTALTPWTAMLPVGALLFLCSDYTLGMLRFKAHPKTVAFMSFSTASYFVAQMLTVLSMYFIIRYP